MIIDCHCHAGQGDGLDAPWNTDAPLGDFLRRARAAGIDHVNLIPTFNTDYRAANRRLGRLVSASRGRFTGFAGINAQSDGGQIREAITEAVREWGACGIKVHRHDARLGREVCEAARELALPILYDVVGEVAPIELMATQYREVAFIVPHLGSFADDWKAQLQLTDHLQRHPNVFSDTSGVRRFDLLLQAVRRAGPGKLVFGSDGPWLHPGVELAKVRALGLRPRDLTLVLGGTFLALTAAARTRGRAARLGRGPAPAPRATA